MIRKPVQALKLLFKGTIAGIVLLLLVEIGLRVNDSYLDQSRDRLLGCPCGTIPSLKSHHELPPLTVIEQVHPDTGERVLWKTNSLGFRDREIQIPKPPGEFRIVCLGDEQILGQFLSDDQLVDRLLEQQLQSSTRMEIRVINAGIPGYSPVLSLIELRNQIVGLQPDLVIFCWNMNDVAEEYSHRRSVHFDRQGQPVASSHPQYGLTVRDRTQDLLLTPNYVRTGLAWLLSERILSKPEPDIAHPSGAYLWLKDNAPDWTMHTQQSLDSIDRMSQICDSIFSEFAVILVPAPWQVSPEACSPQIKQQFGLLKDDYCTSTKPVDGILEYCATGTIHCLDLGPRFRGEIDAHQLFLENSLDLSPLGHQILAEGIAEFMMQRFPPEGLQVGNRR